MMTTKKEQLSRIKKISDTDIWIGYKVYTCYNGIVKIYAGGIEDPEEVVRARVYFKKNKML